MTDKEFCQGYTAYHMEGVRNAVEADHSAEWFRGYRAAEAYELELLAEAEDECIADYDNGPGWVGSRA